MVALGMQRSPRSKKKNLNPLTPASRLQRSVSVPKFSSLVPPLLSSKDVQSVPFSPFRPRTLHLDSSYPLSHEKSSLGCDALDNLLLKNLRQSSTWVDFPHSVHPKRCLDLGCGSGAWIFDAAKEWPECHFVGFDLVDIQPPLQRLGPQYVDRISWMHGNFLNHLPFDDGYFDHVHIRQIARGVPENKWDHVISEVVRVLKPGGTVELFEEDIIFPILPRSSTATPRQREYKRFTFFRHSIGVTKHHSPVSLPPHDHALLEVLFYRVFHRRGINLNPTTFLKRVLDKHLLAARASHVINFPLPPAPPLLVGTNKHDECPSSYDEKSMPEPVLVPQTEESRGSEEETEISMMGQSARRSRSTLGTSVSDFSKVSDPLEGPTAFFSEEGSEFLPKGRLTITEGTLGINLYRSWQGVLACREALWDEYCEAVENNEALLWQVDWEEDDLKATDRQRFETLLSRYRTDMEDRYPVSDALVAHLRWAKPAVQLSKEEVGKRRAVAEARWDALLLERSGIGAVPETCRVCRRMRVFAASKAVK